MVSVLILTHNEHLHLERCINSLQSFAKEVFVVDSYSTDSTVQIAERLGAKVFQNAWINYAIQYQWGLDNCPISTEWIMRMDADEYVTPELAEEILYRLPYMDTSISGVIVNRRVYFMDKWIKHGGYYPIKLLRIWRNGFGTIEQRWMDEHIKLKEGFTLGFENDIVDHNLNNLSWWTDKHNSYATREAIDLLNKKYNIFSQDSIDTSSKEQGAIKRWYKDNLYARSPLFLRSLLYFFYRYFLQFGFLDGKEGLIWHTLQGLWYRFLVDAKITQIEYLSYKEGLTIKEVLETHYNFKL